MDVTGVKLDGDRQLQACRRLAHGAQRYSNCMPNHCDLNALEMPRRVGQLEGKRDGLSSFEVDASSAVA